jgi:glutathione peroxidase
MTTAYDFELKSLSGDKMPFSRYRGQVLLVVNVASKCGLTPHYKGMESLYQQYADQGFKVIGVPCNQFGGQEPGSPEEIQGFCETSYNVTFPLTAKLDVNGDKRHELYGFLAGDEASFPGDISWNFEKFLIGKNGEVLARFAPPTEPEAHEIVSAIEVALQT